MEHVEAGSRLASGAAARSRVYKLLALGFAFPDRDLFDAIRDGAFADALDAAHGALPWASPALAGRDLARPGDAFADFEAEYIRLFDVGAGGAPCPLYGGVYVGDRMKVMEETIRFYDLFHLRPEPQLREMPDHVTTELEFLHYLTFREAGRRAAGDDPTPLVRAARDFLERHPRRWLPVLHDRLRRQETLPFFPALVAHAVGYVRADHQYLVAELHGG